MDPKKIPNGNESVNNAYNPDVMTSPSGKIRIISVTIGTRVSSISFAFVSVITLAILTCLKKRR
jgi:hypothetical protein